MAWSSAAVDAAIAAATAADKPMFLGENHLRNAIIEWRHGGASTWAGADESDSDYPTKRMRDGLYLGTQPTDETSGSVHGILIDFGAGGVDFDVMAIMGIGDRASFASIIEIADDSAYSVNLQTIWDFSAESTYRYANAFSLKYSGVRYMRIQMASAGIDFNVDEIFVGERHQMLVGQRGNYNPDALGSVIEESRTIGGVITRYQSAAGFYKHDGDYLVANATETVNQFWQDSNYGGRSFCYWDAPGTSPNGFRLMMPGVDMLDFPHDGPTVREWSLDATEQGPKFLVSNP